ncbi:MAG: MBOAT family protein [Ruminococcus sp.]|uniref:MBOAT family O-acyltransferase n=1 Tax=Ruminococcus sp. TaxID=41978 RepID=UPI002873A78E|nr:MBOAT family O-acyltransferase [Ruminococcus sp.]MBQ3285216.1 MBOAT family protein [Ruminococcus sp.]
MLFNSYIFIFVFLPITLIGYFALNHFHQNKIAKVWLVICSLFFYAYYNVAYLWVILASMVVNYVLCYAFNKLNKSKTGLRRFLFVLGSFINIGALFFYKYLDFILETANNFFNTDFVYLNLVLPLGISFFTFQQIAYLVDSYKGKAPVYSVVDYALFVTFFPQLIQGPIVLHNEIILQFQDEGKRKFNTDNFAKGLYAFSLGLAKKVIIADNLGKITTFGYGNISSLSSFEAVMTILAYTFQLYFDFSGYCDMANGISYMFNIELPINFNSPYKARNISDFWKRWHMTLTRFLTNYIYFPLGGSRCSTFRTCLNVMIVFLVSGIWHGVGFTFIVWGLMHGVAMVLYRLLKKWIDKVPYAVTWLLTFIFINLTWVFFRALTISDAGLLISRVFSGGFQLQEELVDTLIHTVPIHVVKNIFEFDGALNVILIAIMIGATIICLCTKNVQERVKQFCPKIINLLTTVFLLIWSILSLSGVSTFLYFNF